ncbi:hypothetical protein D2Q93_15375 [Alicyclobacillaceae bacterium I2511]|nr:hypothetical protein D2Q93_15375 [Alicyclobacillaceae bacterium I2511]
MVVFHSIYKIKAKGVAPTRWTDQQNSVIHQNPGHTVVYATPGSGKTAVLTEHIHQVLNKKFVAPDQILALTFTRQAAKEMKLRLQRMETSLQRSVESLRIGTFHSQVFQWLLRQQTSVPQLLTPLEQRQWIAKAMKITGDKRLRDPRQMTSVLSRYKSHFPAPTLPQSVQSLVNRYEIMKRTANRWDFDDILLVGYRLLTAHAEAGLHTFPVQYILIDEFQDTNEIQWKILVRLMAMAKAQIFVVGDDDQSIYAFRGSSPHWLLEADKVLPGVTRHELTENFRSDCCIVSHAAALIHHNQKRAEKSWRVHSKESGICQVFYPSDEVVQAKTLSQSIAFDAQANQTIAVLARTRQQLVDTYHVIPVLQRSQAEFRTFHESKGREWDVVHILDSSRLLRIQGSPEHAKEEEERRLFYVAMTRARRQLQIYSPLIIKGHRSTQNPFLSEAKFIP